MPEPEAIKQQGYRSREVYALFSVLLPSLLVFSLDRLARDALTFLNNIPWWFILVGMACNILASLFQFFLTKPHSGFSSFLRINLLIYLFAWGVFIFFLYNTPQLVIYLGVILALQWVFAYYIFSKFKEYRKFIRFMQDYRGSSLGQKLRANSIRVQNSTRELKSLKKTVYFIAAAVFAAATGLLLAGMIELQPLSLIVCAAYILVSWLFCGILNVYLDEYRFYLDGISLPEKLKQKRWAFACIILFLGLLLSLPMRGDSSIFPPGYLVEGFNWLLRQIPEFDFRIQIPRHLEQNFGGLPVTGGESLADYQESPVWRYLAVILDIFIIAVIALVILAVLYFFFKPLFKKGILKLFRGGHPFALLMKKIKQLMRLLKKTAREVLQALAAFFSLAKKRRPGTQAGIASSPRLMPQRASLKKRRQKNRILKAFLVLIKWGKRRDIAFHPALSPQEYIDFFIDKLPTNKGKLEFITHTFEEAVFSDHIMENTVINSYIHYIKEIISA